MAEPARKRAHIIRSFSDIGTGQRYAAGETPLIEAGAHANYEAAGLIRSPSDEEAAPPPAERPRVSTRSARTDASTAAAEAEETAPSA